ncbi:hypothetical protein F8M41_023715 [Gigaspora margarita]|uniref:Ion transport domain-containing protein n=1 Tax=Gigaspora margarita TaxID=4874 RepID=A0A8H4ET96_GIGMA|nr:hypothetical protein F8M41_023715 [Gigaspora margarita]
MSVSTIQSEHIVEIENKEKEHEVKKYESVIEEDCPEGTEKYFAISPEGDFLNEDGITLEKDLKPENEPNRDEQELSYRKFCSIHNDTKLPFTETQFARMKNVPKPIQKWSVDVSDKSTNSSKFRLLAISCISLEDMKYYEKNYDKLDPTEIQNIQNNGFTFIFIIYNDYSIDNTEDKELLIKYGGIVKLFYEKDYIADKNADDHFLIILTLSGIYNYYALSNNNKLLAYLSFPIKGITIYSIECGLEIAELANILDTNIFKIVDAKDRMFLYFFQNDEKLLIYNSESEFSLAVWDIFISEDDRLPKEDDIQYSFYLDEKKEKLFIIGYHTVQVWYRGTLKFIHSPSPFFDIPDYSEISLSWRPKKIEIIGIKYFSEKFKFNIKVKDAEGIKQIKMNDEDDINVAKNACYTLEYFSVYKKKFGHNYDKMEKLNFDDFIKQTRKIILKFIRLHPTEWRLLDIRFDLMSTLIKAGEHELVNFILFFGELVHIPQYSLVRDGKKSFLGFLKHFKTLALRLEFEKDNTLLACFLEYYSNYAVYNIGWMNTVVDIIPELFKSNEENVPAFATRNLIYSLLKFLNYDKIANIRMVPLMNFTMNKRISDIKKGKLTNFLEILFSPSQYLSPKEVNYSPFIKLIEACERDILYENPSLGAVVNWMCYILVHYYTFENGFKNAESSQIFKFIIFLSILVLWYEFILLLRIFEDFAQNLNILFNIIIALRQFLLFFILVIIAMGHALFIFLGYSSYAGLNQTSEEENPFSNIIDSILAVYDWSSISFDTWNFWQLTIISVIGSFIFVIILQNVIISFMSEAFSDAAKDSKHGLYRYQFDLIHEFALLEKSLEFNDIDSMFKDKIIAKYICFYDDPHITKSWKKKSKQIRLKPYPKIQTLDKSKYESLSTEEDIYTLFS